MPSPKRAARPKGVVRRPRARKPTPEYAREIYDRLAAHYPDARCALDYGTPFQLLVATILSAQCTDKRVNMVTPALFRKYRTPAALAGADPAQLEELIKSTGFYRNKAKNLLGM
ncbi:MAG TPA: endonuclease III, partial [Polyangiales bacterium]